MAPGPASGTAHLGLGSNLGDRAAHLARAALGLSRAGLEIAALSSVYETEPVGPVRDQPDFLNAVLCVRPGRLAPEELLALCLRIERDLGRTRTVDKGPREIDIDLLLVGDLVLERPGLGLPHPELARRAFVLVPLLELDPGLVDPRDGVSLAQRLAALPPEAGRVRRALPFPPLDRRWDP
jgi:2-amino-4-hydroxy-6-hydroxymethyldihydropteridine diphosphokinase